MITLYGDHVIKLDSGPRNYIQDPGYLEFGYYEHPVITSRFASQ